MLDNTVGNNIRYFRRKNGMTQKDLATKLYITRQALSTYEIGERIPNIYLLSKMGDIFGITVDDFLKYHDDILKYIGY